MTLNCTALAAFFNHEEPGNIEPVYMLEKVEKISRRKWDVHNFYVGFQRRVTDDALGVSSIERGRII